MIEKQETVAEKGLLSKSFEFISKHYLLLSTIPLIFGGIHQLFNLYKLGSQFLRFFSVSQLINDGLILLLYTVFFTCIAFLYIYLQQTYSLTSKDYYGRNTFNEEKRRSRIEKINLLRANVVVGILIMIVFFLNYDEIVFVTRNIIYFIFQIYRGVTGK